MACPARFAPNPETTENRTRAEKTKVDRYDEKGRKRNGRLKAQGPSAKRRKGGYVGDSQRLYIQSELQACLVGYQ
jgi:hypothetical protein